MSLTISRKKHGARFSASANALLSRMFVAWETDVFNKPLFKWGLRRARYLKLWFGFGVGFGISLMGVMFFLVPFQITTLLLELSSRRTKKFTEGSGQVFTLVVGAAIIAKSLLSRCS